MKPNTPPVPVQSDRGTERKEPQHPTKLRFEDDKAQQVFCSLDLLRKAAWDRFDKRREFEWRIALALWAGMGGFGALTVAKDSALRGLNVVVFAAATVLILVGLHISFLKGITKRNTLDSDMSSEYEDEMRKLIHWTFADATIEHERSRAKRQHRSLLTNYSPRFQLLVTLCLGVIIVAALVWKSMQVDSLTK